jgi:hypothetical protein
VDRVGVSSMLTDLEAEISEQDEWIEIRGFRSMIEYRRFSDWLDGQLSHGVISDIPVGERYSGATTLEERWIRRESEEIWRLVAPDPPFRGVFEKVRFPDSHAGSGAPASRELSTSGTSQTPDD